MIEAIVFKLRDVLAFQNREKAYALIAEHVPHDSREVAERVEESGLIDQFNRNEMQDDQFFVKLMNLFDPPHTLEFSDFYRLWGDVYTTNRGLLRFLPRLRGDLKLVLMADLSVIELESFMQKHREVLEPFGENVIYSSDEGVVAPESKYFAKALEKLGNRHKFSDLFYIDSELQNVSAATQLGITGHHYVGLLEFFGQLKKMELLA